MRKYSLLYHSFLINYILMSFDFIEFPYTWFLLIIIERDGARHAVVGFLIDGF